MRAAVAALADPQVHPARRRVLESLGDHWTGLTVFVEHPAVPMDNNTAERAPRGPVVGRKNYYGSGAVWAGRLAAMMFSLLPTLCLWQLNPRSWLTAYLTACAEAGGDVPEDVERFLPWNLSDADRQRWSLAGAEVAADTSSGRPPESHPQSTGRRRSLTRPGPRCAPSRRDANSTGLPNVY